jgi:hypothetical protein
LFAIVLLLPALAAMAPSITWCVLNWDQVSAASYLRCLTHGMPDGGCASAASRVAVSSCSAAGGAEASCATGSGCPLAQASTSHSARARAYCLGDPAGGRAIRSHAPLIVEPGNLATLIVVTELLAPEQPPAQTAWPELEARSPTRLAATRPPVRAPPLEQS